jgi:DNA-binding MarR family transcriptional regulator
MEVGFLVTRLARQEVRRSRPAGLSLQQFRAVAAVAGGSAPSPTELARHLGLAPATVTRLLDGLVRRRLLRRRPGAQDARSRVLEATALGRRRLEETFELFRGLIARRVSSLPPRARARITRAAESLRPVLLEEFPTYSARSATTGSTRVARRAGIQVAAKATNTRPPATREKITGSTALVW